MGERHYQLFQLTVLASLTADFQGSRVTSDPGVILVRELDERAGLSKEPRPAGRAFCKPRGNLSPLRYELPFLPALPSGASWQIFVNASKGTWPPLGERTGLCCWRTCCASPSTAGSQAVRMSTMPNRSPKIRRAG